MKKKCHKVVLVEGNSEGQYLCEAGLADIGHSLMWDLPCLKNE